MCRQEGKNDGDCCYQGYLCPGYLVTRTDRESLRILEDNWRSHSLVTPDKYKILTVGLAQDCSLAPFTQVYFELFNFGVFDAMVTEA